MRRILPLALLLGPANALALPAPARLLFLEPPSLPLAGGYVVDLEAPSGPGAEGFEGVALAALHDPDRGSPEHGGLLAAGLAGPDAVVERRVPPLLAANGVLPDGPRARRHVRLHVVLEDPEYWEGWRVEQERVPGEVGGNGSAWTYCLSRDATVRGTLRLLDADGGGLLLHEPLEAVASLSECASSRDAAEGRLPGDEVLLDQALEQLALDVADRVAPRWVGVPVQLERRRSTQRGLRLLLGEGNVLAATRWFVDAARHHPDDPWLHYHAAVLLTAALRFAEAREALEAARALQPAPAFDVWEEELHRRERASLVLRKLGVPQEPLDF